MSADEFNISFAGGRRIGMDELRQAKTPLMPDGGHAWVINAICGLDDPEQALDRMELGETNFVGVTDIYCLVCHTKYQTMIRHFKCPQVPQDR